MTKLARSGSWLVVAVMAASCNVSEVGDDFWAETRDDDGDDSTADALAGTKQVAIDPGPTDHAELVDLLPVGRSESGAIRRVVLRLGPGQLPGLQRGDRLIVPAEVQATTRCDVGQSAPGCNYNPNIRAQLIITGNPNDTEPGGAGSKAIATQTQTCTHADHHCMFVFTPSDASIEVDGLPCVASDSCHVNVVMWAWHADARAGDQDKVLVGGNDGDYLDNGRVEGDVARLMVVRERGIVAGDRAARETSGGGNLGVNTSANPVVIYSHRLKGAGDDLLAGEQFVVEAKLVTAVGDRARISAQLVVSKSPDGTDNGVDKIAPGSISEQNGVNCTAGTSPCVTRKVAVFRVTDAITGPVYVNVVAKSAVPGGGTTNVTVRRDDGWIRSVRYNALFGR
jgi:hypothetical protein